MNDSHAGNMMILLYHCKAKRTNTRVRREIFRETCKVGSSESGIVDSQEPVDGLSSPCSNGLATQSRKVAADAATYPKVRR